MPSARLLPATGCTGCPSSGCRNLAQPFTGALVHQISACLQETGDRLHWLPFVWLPEPRSAVHRRTGSPAPRVPGVRVVGVESSGRLHTHTQSSPKLRSPEAPAPDLLEIVVLQAPQLPSSPDVAIPRSKRAHLHPISPLLSISLEAITPAAPFLLTPATGKRGRRFHPAKADSCPRNSVTST